MKFLVVVSSLAAVALARPGGYSYGPVQHGYHGPAAPLAHDGRVVDTPEVAHAKAAHLAAHAEAATKVAYGGPALDDHGYGYENGYAGHSLSGAYNAGHGYHGPPAPLDHKGRVIDTPDVAHAKIAHFAAHADAAHYAPAAHYDDGNYGHAATHGYGAPAHGYHGPAAPLGHDGRVVDTPEVAHAKAAHLAAHAEVSVHSPYGGYGAYEAHGPAYKW